MCVSLLCALSVQVHSTVSDSCLVPLASSSQLLVLSLAFFKGRFGPEACSVLGDLGQLQHLDLQGSMHADGALMKAVGRLSMLQSLHISRCDLIDDAALQHITGLTNLHTLNISICSRITDVGLAAVTQLQNLSHLLAQHCKAITDSGVALLGRLERLQVLDLSMCERVTGSGFLAFAGCLQMATLSLNGCSSLNDAGLRAIGRITSLTKLDLGSCRLITDVGVSFLAGLAGLTGERSTGHCALLPAVCIGWLECGIGADSVGARGAVGTGVCGLQTVTHAWKGGQSVSRQLAAGAESVLEHCLCSVAHRLVSDAPARCAVLTSMPPCCCCCIICVGSAHCRTNRTRPCRV